MNKLFPIIMLLLVLALCFAACENSAVAPIEVQDPETDVLSKATTITSEATLPFSSRQFVYCANGGEGEWVNFTGTLHTVSHTTIDATGSFHASLHSTVNLTGVGEITGDEYVGNGTRNRQVNGETLPYETTAIRREIYVAPGPDNNLKVQYTVHRTINANGTVTSNVTDMSTECQ